MKISLCFTHPQSILGVYDFLFSDESNQSYIKNGPGPSMPWIFLQKRMDSLQEAFSHTFIHTPEPCEERLLDCWTETPADCNYRA